MGAEDERPDPSELAERTIYHDGSVAIGSDSEQVEDRPEKTYGQYLDRLFDEHINPRQKINLVLVTNSSQTRRRVVGYDPSSQELLFTDPKKGFVRVGRAYMEAAAESVHFEVDQDQLPQALVYNESVTKTDPPVPTSLLKSGDIIVADTESGSLYQFEVVINDAGQVRVRCVYGPENSEMMKYFKANEDASLPLKSTELKIGEGIALAKGRTSNLRGLKIIAG